MWLENGEQLVTEILEELGIQETRQRDWYNVRQDPPSITEEKLAGWLQRWVTSRFALREAEFPRDSSLLLDGRSRVSCGECRER